MPIRRRASTNHVNSNPLAIASTVILAAAAFTPYLGTSLNVRYEHLIVYGALLLVLSRLLLGRRLWLGSETAVLLGSWLALGALCTVNTLGRSYAGLTSLDPLAVMDAFVLPIAFFTVSYALGIWSNGNGQQLLRVGCGSIIIALSLNSLLILIFDLETMKPLLRYFWANPSELAVTVADKALGMDRFGGIFNQPFDAGVGYAIGFAAWIYLFVGKGPRSRWSWILGLLSLALLLSGGVSAQSKAFTYGALLIAGLTLLQLWRVSSRRGSTLLRLVVGILGAAWLAGFLGLVESFDRTVTMVTAIGANPSERYSGVRAASGGRSESFGEYVDNLLRDASWVGDGFSGALDDAFRAYLSGAGLVGLALFTLVFVGLAALVRRQLAGSAERMLALNITVYMAFASFGAVSLQVNRGSSLFWLLAGLLAANTAVLVKTSSAHSRSPREHGPHVQLSCGLRNTPN